MCIQIIKSEGQLTLIGLQHLEPYRVSYLKQTVSEWQSLIRGKRPISLSQLANRIECSNPSLKATCNAEFLRSTDSDAARHKAMGEAQQYAA